MKLVRFAENGTARYGVLDGDIVRPTDATTLQDALAITGLDALPVPLKTLDLLAPVERPRKILGRGAKHSVFAECRVYMHSFDL